MRNCREQIEGAIQATVFHSGSAYSWFGKPSPRLTAHFERALSPTAIQTWLLSTLHYQLYSDFYGQGTATPSVKESNALAHLRAGSFIDDLSSANRGAGFPAEGWRITSLPNNELIARRNGLALRVQHNDCIAVNGRLLDPAARVSLRFPKELLGISPGFYMAVSDIEMPDSKDAPVPVVRFYWNLRPEAAVPLMQELTRGLNSARLPFRFKVLNDQAAFRRCDAAVLYIHKSDYEAVAQILKQIYPKINQQLNEGVPAFTKRLAPGLGFAEDPGTKNDSFGTHRCRLLAEGMFRAYQRGRKSLPDRLRTVEQHFAERQISLETPYLNPGSADTYEFRFNGARLGRSDSRESRPVSNSTKGYLDAATRIASRLVRQAIWHEDRCNWLGFQPLERSVTPQSNATLSALGPDLYSGTSGVALFLGELCAATGEPELRRTALGAIAQAVSRLDVLPAPARPSLYAGWIGIALVAARLGRILQDENLIRTAVGIVQRCKREKLDNWEFDLFYGKAGMIVGLLTLGELLDKPDLLKMCVPLARKLLDKAHRSKAGYSWPSSAMPSRRNLTGFSHGAAGVGCALLELFQATGDSKYRRAAESAFAYERHWYDASQHNWPDLREEPSQPGPKRNAFPCLIAWCHGAAGIALSRLRAYEILKDNTCKAEALVALETTRRAIQSWLHSPSTNYSLCHGLSGNAEVLRYGSAVLEPVASEASKAILQVAAKGIESFCRTEYSWPCGTPAGENPSLMLGLAGIGHFYLRLAIPSVPSILILRREGFSKTERLNQC